MYHIWRNIVVVTKITMTLNVSDNGKQKMKFEIDQCYARNADGQIIRMKMYEWVDIMSQEMNGYDGCNQSTGSNGSVIGDKSDRNCQ